jgi:hypothetical protein
MNDNHTHRGDDVHPVEALWRRRANMGLANLSVDQLNAKRNHIVGLMKDNRRSLQAIDAWLDLKAAAPTEGE